MNMDGVHCPKTRPREQTERFGPSAVEDFLDLLARLIAREHHRRAAHKLKETELATDNPELRAPKPKLP
jgi:hypothetical protein